MHWKVYGKGVWVFINVRPHINRYCLWQAAATSNDDGEQTSAITVGICRSAREQPPAASATCWLFPPRIQLVNRANVSYIIVFMIAASSCSCDLVNEWGNEAHVHSRNCQRRPNVASETSSINIASDVKEKDETWRKVDIGIEEIHKKKDRQDT